MHPDLTSESTVADTNTPQPKPWRTIWLEPRRTIREILAADPRPSWVPVIALACLSQGIGALQRSDTEGFSASNSFMPVVLGMAQVIFGVLIGPYLLAWVGGWFGGDAEPDDIRHGTAWSWAPAAVGGIFWIPVLVAFGGVLPSYPEPRGFAQLLAMPLVFCVLAAGLWSMGLAIILFAEIQRFSILKAIVCYVILAIPLIVLAALR